VGVAWNPWAELRARPHLYFLRTELPPVTGGGVYWPLDKPGQAAVLIDERAGRVERRCLLAHELVHDERGGGISGSVMPRSWAAVIAREERCVDDIVARRLVPLDDLLAFARAKAEIDGHATAADVAEQFDVTEEVATRALELAGSGRS
jgi:hypothetical protein